MPKNRNNIDPVWLKIPAIAQYTQNSERTVRPWIKKGLRHVRINGKVYSKKE